MDNAHIYIYMITVTLVYAQNALADSLIYKIHINEEGAKVFENSMKFSICKSLNIKMTVKKGAILQEVTNIKGEGGQDPKQGLDMNRTPFIKVERDKEENL